MSCRDYRPLLTQNAEGGLPESEERLLKDHLRECDDCRKRYRIQKMNDRAIQSMLLVPTARASAGTGDNRMVKALIWGTFLVGFVLLLLYTAYKWLGNRGL